jgi:hypothetical protein
MPTSGCFSSSAFFSMWFDVYCFQVKKLELVISPDDKCVTIKSTVPRVEVTQESIANRSLCTNNCSYCSEDIKVGSRLCEPT